MSSKKVKIIQNWPELEEIKNIQFFLSFANFYCWFIFKYSDIVIPLMYPTQKNIFWKFDFCCHDTFKFLKKTFISAPIFIY